MRDDTRFLEARALLIVGGFASTFTYPVPNNVVHIANYFSDALAPLWGERRTGDRVVLKRRGAPRSSQLQQALDRLVGNGMLNVDQVQYELFEGQLELNCRYSLNRSLTSKLDGLLAEDHYWSTRAKFYEELATAIAPLGSEATSGIQQDASYSDPLADIDTVVDLASTVDDPSLTVKLNQRIESLAQERFGRTLKPSELTGLYLRHLLRAAVRGRGLD